MTEQIEAISAPNRAVVSGCGDPAAFNRSLTIPTIAEPIATATTLIIRVLTPVKSDRERAGVSPCKSALAGPWAAIGRKKGRRPAWGNKLHQHERDRTGQ
jgi:hypothetical protein